jgi:hypothetical protein
MHTSAGRVPSVYRGTTHARRATAQPLVVARSTGADGPKRRRIAKAQQEVPKEVVTPDIMSLSFDAGSFDEPPAEDSKAPKKKPTQRRKVRLGWGLGVRGRAGADAGSRAQCTCGSVGLSTVMVRWVRMTYPTVGLGTRDSGKLARENTCRRRRPQGVPVRGSITLQARV